MRGAKACKLRSEDQDFFGSGVATWNTDRVEFIYREFETKQNAPSLELQGPLSYFRFYYSWIRWSLEKRCHL